MLSGLMMDRPLSVPSILDYAAEIHGEQEIVSARVEGDRHRQSFAATRERALRLAAALRAMGIESGDRVATLAWNGYRHLELYYAIAGIGAVCHTINPRLFPEQISWIATHAEDRVLFFDADLAPLVADLAPQLPKGIRLVCLGDTAPTALPGALAYEALIAGHAPASGWTELPERAASGLCYTSGTTGNPKGALYSHRSTVLHAMAAVLAVPSSFGTDQRVLPAVPLFHVNAWGLPFSALLSGTDLVMPGPRLDGASLFQLMDQEAVTAAWGVPTVWSGLIDEMRAQGRKPRALHSLLIGGSAVSEAQIRALESEFGIAVLHGWGMTELSPLGSVTRPRRDLPLEDRIASKLSQGQRLFGVEMRIIGDDGQPRAQDGQAVGELAVRGNNVIAGYFNDAEASARALDETGWFRTGDVSRIDGSGAMTIVDRTKDLIKSGGEWISSIDLENAATGCPGVAQAAAIGISHEKWGERPLLVIVREAGASVTGAAIAAHLGASLAKWQIPQHIVFRDSLPMTATGKVSKLDLRRIISAEGLPEA
ncbi:long-chain fatty acid--CoA ligase [Paracoccus zhejiangensis]|uniref:long-chain fatty acid--CoA ligase n=1 Tax=Paracoccus zhejiangensis TaxID=1077935 RepID=UPI001E316A21|nr:long-chain fatty acid--CoA ligase [Paracoccus zhejiangensis]